MDPWVENFERAVCQFGPELVSVERLSATRSDGSIYTGVYAESAVESCAAEIEVWKGPAGWDLTISDAFSREFDSSEGSRASVEGLIWLTISGGAELVASKFRKFLVPAPNQADSRSRMIRDGLVVRREWCSWGVTLPSEFGGFNSSDCWQRI